MKKKLELYDKNLNLNIHIHIKQTRDRFIPFIKLQFSFFKSYSK